MDAAYPYLPLATTGVSGVSTSLVVVMGRFPSSRPDGWKRLSKSVLSVTDTELTTALRAIAED